MKPDKKILVWFNIFNLFNFTTLKTSRCFTGGFLTPGGVFWFCRNVLHSCMGAKAFV